MHSSLGGEKALKDSRLTSAPAGSPYTSRSGSSSPAREFRCTSCCRAAGRSRASFFTSTRSCGCWAIFARCNCGRSPSRKRPCTCASGSSGRPRFRWRRSNRPSSRRRPKAESSPCSARRISSCVCAGRSICTACSESAAPHRPCRSRSTSRKRSSERFPETPDPFDLLETEGGVGFRAVLVVDLRVRGKFGAALRAAPLFGGADQGAADALATLAHIHPPSLEIRDAIGRTTLGDVSDRQLYETDQRAAVVRHQDRERLVQEAREELVDLVRYAVGPERESHPPPLFGIGRRDGPDVHSSSSSRSRSASICAVVRGSSSAITRSFVRPRISSCR